MRPTLTAIVRAFFTTGLLAGCDRWPPPPADAQMTTEQIIRKNGAAPVEQSINPVAASLARHSVFVATDGETSTQPTTVKLDKLRFKTANDNQGRTWAYAYTNQAEFARAFPQGGGFAELSFRDFFDIIERDGRFAGVFLNAGSDAAYPIPRELFEDVKQVLQRPAGG